MKLYDYQGRANISGERIRRQREKLGFSQEQLAAKLQILNLEIGQKAVSRVETGLRVVPDFELQFFAQALEVSILWLLGED